MKIIKNGYLNVFLFRFLMVFFVLILSSCTVDITVNKMADALKETSLVKISVADSTYSVNENGSLLVIGLLSQPAPTASVVSVAVTSNRGDQNDDFVLATQTISIPNGATQFTFTVNPVDDSIYEGDENFSLALSSTSTGFSKDPININLIVRDNDNPPVVSFAAATSFDTEGAAGAVTVNLDHASAFAIDVPVTHADGTAVSTDYSVTTTIVHFAPGEISKTIAVTATQDIISEQTETFILSLGSPQGTATLGATISHTFSIVDDETSNLTITGATVTEGGDLVFNVNVNPLVSSDVSVSYTTQNGTGIAGTNYTAKSGTLVIPANTSSATITVNTLNSAAFCDPDRAMTVVLSNSTNASIGIATATGTIVDDDLPTVSIANTSVSESATSLDLTASIAAACSSHDVSFNWTTSSGTATAVSDFTSVTAGATIPAGSTSVTLSVPLVSDNLYEGNENFTVILSSFGNATNTANLTATATILEDDSAPVMSINSVTVTEGGTASFQVSLNTVSGVDASAPLATSSGTATSGTDFTAVSQTVTIPAGSTSATVTVSTVDDAVICEADETFSVGLSSLVNATAGSSGTGTILENDFPDITLANVSATEGGNLDFTATLSQVCSGRNVKFRWRTFDNFATAGLDYTESSGIVTITAGNLTSALGDIRVPTIDDTLNEPDEDLFVSLLVDENLDSLSPTKAIAIGTIQDNDAAQPVTSYQVVASGTEFNPLSRQFVIGSNGIVKPFGVQGRYGLAGLFNVGDEPNEMGDNLPAIDAGAGAGVGFTKMAFALSAICVVTTTNTVRCWGGGAEGNLGNGNIYDYRFDSKKSNEFSLASAPHVIEDIQSGGVSFCALMYYTATPTQKFLKCWGSATNGLLGNGSSTNDYGDNANEMGDNLPTLDFGTGLTVKQLAYGSTHACVLLSNDRVKCWGNGGYGILGNGSSSGNLGDDPNEMGDNLPYVDLGTSDGSTPWTVKKIVAGNSLTCAILANDRVKCWGAAVDLGIGTNIGSIGDAPGEMGDNLAYVMLGTSDGATPWTVKDIATARYYYETTCVILSNDQVKCWGGGNGRGEFGLGNTSSRVFSVHLGDNLPTLSLGVGRSAKKIFVGERQTCILLDTNETKCVGDNHAGQLGFGNTLGNNVQFGDQAGETIATSTVVDVGLGRTISDMSLYEQMACAILDNNTLKCWGYTGGWNNGYGTFKDIRFGDNPDEMGVHLKSVNLGTNVKAKALQASCFLTYDGWVKCFADGSYNARMGVPCSSNCEDWGTYVNHLGDNWPYTALPTGKKALNLTPTTNYGICALLDDFTVRCWGGNANGELGLGSSISDYGIGVGHMGDNLAAVNLGSGVWPVMVQGTCALLSNQKVKCWGKNNYGQLGIGSVVTSIGKGINDMGDNLQYVNFGTTGFTGGMAKVISLTQMQDSYCALFEDKKAKCWGRNDLGQLGAGDAVGRGGAGQIGDSMPFVSVPTNRTIKRMFNSGGPQQLLLLDDNRLYFLGMAYQFGTYGVPAATNYGDSLAEIGNGLIQSYYNGGSEVVSMSIGTRQASYFGPTCIIDASGGLKCWGAAPGSVAPLLGYGDSLDYSTPTDFTNFLNTPAAYIDMGW